MNHLIDYTPQAISQEELNDLIIDCVQDVKGKNIIKLDLTKLEDRPTDYFIICEGDSNTQVKAITDRIFKRLKNEISTFPGVVEGQRTGLWVCLDYFNTVVHVFHRDTRNFYGLEDLWGDAITTEYSSL